MKTQSFFTRGIFVLMVLLNGMPTQAQDPREIIRRMEDKMRGDASYSEVTMTMVRPRFTREVSMKSWSLGEQFALILITAPARDKGTAFLKRGNEVWNYLPGIDRTIKMPPSMMSQSWMGSDFTNDDLVRGVSIVDDYLHKLLRTEMFEGQECYVVEMIPKLNVPVVFDKVIYWITKQHFLPVKLENYDEFGELASTINFREIKLLGGREVPTLLEIVPAGRTGHKTVLTTSKADYTVNLSENFFTIQNLTNVR